MASIFELENPVFGSAARGFTLSSVTADADKTLAANQVVSTITSVDPDANRTIKLPLANEIIAQLKGCQEGTVFDFFLENKATVAEDYVLTMGAADGTVTYNNTTNVVLPATTRHFFGRVVSMKKADGSGTDAILIYTADATEIKAKPRRQKKTQGTNAETEIVFTDASVTTIEIVTFNAGISADTSIDFTIKLPAFKSTDNLLITNKGTDTLAGAIMGVFSDAVDGQFKFSIANISKTNLSAASRNFIISIVPGGKEVT